MTAVVKLFVLAAVATTLNETSQFTSIAIAAQFSGALVLKTLVIIVLSPWFWALLTSRAEFMFSAFQSSSKKLLFIAGIFLLASSQISAASPRTNYLLFCSGCHRPSGEGKHPNVPTLVAELGRMMSVPEMRQYLVRVPGAFSVPISDADLTEVINWLLIEFNSDTLPRHFEKLSVDEVSEARKNILADPLKYRELHWKSYDD
jgi:cytochrome c553